MRKIYTIILLYLFLINSSFAETVSPEIYFERGYVHFVRGEYGNALEAFQHFILAERAGAEPRRLKIAMMHQYRGKCFEQLNLTDRAIEENLLALELFEELSDSVKISDCVSRLGNLFYKENKLMQATHYLNEANRYFEKMKWIAKLQLTEFQLGIIEFQTGNYSNARQHFHQSLSINELYKMASEHTYLKGETWFFLAKAAVMQDSILKAKELLIKAENDLQLYVRELPHFYNLLIDVLIFKSELLTQLDAAQSRAILRQAEQISEANSQVNKALEIDLAKAKLFSRTGDFQNAEKTFHAIQREFADMEMPDGVSENYYEFLLLFSEHYSARYIADSNRIHLEKSFQLLEDFHNINGLNKKVYALLQDRSLDGESLKLIFDRTISVCFQLYKLTGNQYYFESAFSYADKFSQGLFTERMELARAGIQDLATEKEQVIEAEIRLKINQSLARFEDEKDRSTERQVELTSLISQLEKLNLSKNTDKNRNAYIAPGNLVTELKQNLSDASYLKFYETGNEIFQFLVTCEEIEFRAIPKTVEFQNAATFYTGFISNPGTGIDVPRIKMYSDAAYYLYNQLLYPLHSKFSKGDIFVDWSGDNSHFVFESLVTAPVKDVSINMNGLPFFILERNIFYSGSVNLFISIVPRNLTNKPLNYCGLAPFAANGIGRRVRLQSSGTEVKNLARIFGGMSFSSVKAKKITLQERASESQILHLATHAQKHAIHPQLAELSFFGENGQADKLFFYEILNSEWENRLILLGACGTSDGEYIPNYGTVSLSNAFHSGGAESVIGANWQSNDFASLKIFSEMAELIKAGEETGESLRQSKIKFLKESNDLFSHPYYWAVYTYHGNQQQLVLNSDKHKYLNTLIVLLSAGLLVFYLIKKFLCS